MLAFTDKQEGSRREKRQADREKEFGGRMDVQYKQGQTGRHGS